MANSFFLGTDSQLYAGTKNFADIIDTDFAMYGISSAQNTNYQSLSANYVAAYEALLTPSTRNKAQTAAKNSAKILLKLAASDLARIIEGQSTVSDAQKVLLGINVRKTPGPVGAPGQPTEPKVTISAIGEVELKWKCINPVGSQGTTYNVFRYSGGGVPTDADYQYIGGTGVREFTDMSAPAVPMIMYKIQAVRSTAVGPWATFNVFLGVSSGGTTMLEKVVNTSPKIAA